MAKVVKKPRYVRVPWTAEQRRRFEEVMRQIRAKKGSESGQNGKAEATDDRRP